MPNPLFRYCNVSAILTFLQGRVCQRCLEGSELVGYVYVSKHVRSHRDDTMANWVDHIARSVWMSLLSDKSQIGKIGMRKFVCIERAKCFGAQVPLIRLPLFRFALHLK